MKPQIKGDFYMSKTIVPVLLTCLLLALSSPALAYIGPGAGISVLGSLLTILGTIFVAIGAIIFWPLRKFLKRRKSRRDAEIHAEVANQADVGQRINSANKSTHTRQDIQD